MIIIKDASNCIVLGDGSEFVIYAYNYLIEEDSNDLHLFGDITIQTPSMKYSFKRVYEAELWAREIQNCIVKYVEKGKKNCVIDLDELIVQIEDNSILEFGYEDFSIINLQCQTNNDVTEQ